MNNTDFSNHAETMLGECLNLLTRKGRDYAQSSEDRLINFKTVATSTGGTPHQVLLTYMMKHVDSVCQAVQANPNCPATTTEPLRERLKDIINYCVLFEALSKDNGLGQVLEQT